MNAQEALLRAILADPADDLPRLAMADWLEENGQDARAEFVRVQVELALVDAEVVTLGKCHCSGPDPTGCSRCREGKRRGLWVRRDRLRHRELSLWRGADAVSLGGLGFDFWAGVGVTPGLDWFSRGLISRVSAPLQAWWERGRQIVRSHPVEALELSDRAPLMIPELPVPALLACVADDSGPHPPGMHVLPLSIWRLLPAQARESGAGIDAGFALFPDADSAREAANAAALAWARS